MLNIFGGRAITTAARLAHVRNGFAASWEADRSRVSTTRQITENAAADK